MMKKLTILTACCLLSAVGMKAAPPLRGLVPMQSGSDSLHPQLSTLPPPLSLVACVVSQWGRVLATCG